MKTDVNKIKVLEFWDRASCGEELYLNSLEKESFQGHSEARYQLEPYILNFADFNNAKGKKVLEIGVGLGADHQKFAEAGANLYGIDLTERAIAITKKRFDLFDLRSELSVGDGENLSFSEASFDMVYSWGVLHHSPNTAKAIGEVFRVLKPGGMAKVMIYHKYSMVGLMLWLRYALLKGNPFLTMDYIYSHYLESPGTKAYTIVAAKKLFSDFKSYKIETVLTHGDLLSSNVGQSHRGLSLAIAKFIWPSWFIKLFFKKFGLFMLIEAHK